MKTIIYEINNNVYVVKYTEEINLIDRSKKLIKKGIPFWVVSDCDLPTTSPETWDLSDMPEPDGYGESDD
jgi:hypothetical protein